MSKPRQNYHSESESELNKQINLHLYSSYRYQAMVSQIEMYEVFTGITDRS